MVDLSIVIACYNEGEILEKNLEELLSVMGQLKYSYELIFIDDKSQDRTPELIKNFIAAHPGVRCRSIFHEQNIGRGGTVTEGLRHAEGEIAGFLDIDLEIHARYIPSFVLAIERGADVAVARRIYKLYLRGMVRHFLSRAYHKLTRMMLGVTLEDTEAGYKFFRRSKILPILETCQDKHWFWDTEIMVRSLRAGLKVVEIPCLFLRNFEKPSTVKLWRDSIRYLKSLRKFSRELKRTS